MKKQTIIVGAFLLAIGGFLAKAIGAIYKIPLANILGSNGMGVYYLIFPLYSMLLVLVSSGISIAVSKMVSYERACNNKKNETTILTVSLTYVFFLSAIVSLLLVVVSEPISLLQGNANATMGYLAIAPALIFASLISVVRAYFQGLENMIPTSLSNVAEQIVKLVFGLLLANLFLDKGVEYAVFGAILAVTISEFAAFLLIVLNYFSHKRKNRYHEKKQVTSQTLSQKEVFVTLFRYSLPSTMSSLVIPITGFFDSFMVINLLVNAGQSTAVATSLYGINNGIVNTIVSLPVIFTMALSCAIVPNISGLHAKNNASEVGFKSSFFIKLSWIFSLLCFVLILIFAPDIIELLYSKGLTDRVINEYEFAYKLLTVSSVSVVYYSFLHTFTSILQSINKPSVPFLSMMVALVVRTALLVLLIGYPQINIFAVSIANVAFLTVATILNLWYIRRFVPLKFDFLRLFVIPTFGAVLTAVVLFAGKAVLVEALPPLVYLLILGLVGASLYAAILWVLKVFTKKELSLFPSMRKFSKRTKKEV